MIDPLGFLRITAASPQTAVGDPAKNLEQLWEVVEASGDSDVVLLPELGLTGYTAADLFSQEPLLRAAEEGLAELIERTAGRPQLVVVGFPCRADGSLYNAAAAVADGQLLAVVPKQHLPTYQEFYEGRWFRPAVGSEPAEVRVAGRRVPFGIDLLLDAGAAVFGIEICEDLWTPLPPSCFQALAGANVLLNLSASNEIIGKARWRTDLVVSQSGRCLAAYAYAGSGPTESTTDLVFGGHCLIAENGAVLDQSRRVGDGQPPWQGATWARADIDLQRLAHDRRVIGTFATSRPLLPRTYRRLEVPLPRRATPRPDLLRPNPGRPFVPAEGAEREDRCAEIFGIQTAALAKRVSRLPEAAPLVIGVSGGLDSTLALLVAVKACDAYQWPRRRIHAVTMPGFGTTAATRRNAWALMTGLGVSVEEIDIRPLSIEAFRSLDHAPLGIDLEGLDVEQLQRRLAQSGDDAEDLVFENVQARLRTFLLMSRGFVLGTGDLSEQALGWSTYNGDHMSMYNVNTSVPKTLVRFLVHYVADHHFDAQVAETLHAIAETPISPELLPMGPEGHIRQSTEEQLGPYELHDFFLFHVIRNGFGREKILHLAAQAHFSKPYDPATIQQTLETFYRRFFANQFKRSCVPDGPKVGSVSLSPRGDWRMPSDADRGPF